MPKLPRIALTFLLLLALLTTPALAGEWIEGDGYRFRLPDGFFPVEGGGSMNRSMGMGGLLGGSDLEMEMRVFARDPSAPGQNMLAVMRILVTGPMGEQLKSQWDPAKMRQELEAGRGQAEAALAQRGMDLDVLRPITLGIAHEGVEMRMDAAHGMGQSMRMAIAVHDESMYMFMLQGTGDTDAEDEAAWATLTTSVKLKAPNKIMRFVKKNWPFLAGGIVVVLLFLLLNFKAGSSRPRGSFTTRGEEASGLSRAMDGLPTYGMPMEPPASTPPRPPSRPEPAAAPATPAAPVSAGEGFPQPPSTLPPTPGQASRRTIPISKAPAPGLDAFTRPAE